MKRIKRIAKNKNKNDENVIFLRRDYSLLDIEDDLGIKYTK